MVLPRFLVQANYCVLAMATQPKVSMLMVKLKAHKVWWDNRALVQQNVSPRAARL